MQRTPLLSFLPGLSVASIKPYWPVALLVLSFLLSFNELVNGTAVLCVGLIGFLFYKSSKRDRTKPFTIHLIDLAIAISIVIELIAFTQSSFSFNSRPFLLIVFHAIVTFYFVRLTMTSEQLYRSLFWCIGLVGLYYGLLTLKKAYFMMAHIAGHGFTDLSQFRNAYSPVVASNEWALFLLLLLPFTTCLSLLARHRFLRLLAGATTLIIVYCLLLGFSRGGYIAATVFFIIVGVGLLSFTRQLFPHFVKVMVIIGLVIGVVAGFHWKPVRTTLMMNETVSQQRSTESRWRMWDVGKVSLKTDPVFGVGAFNFPFKYNTAHQRTIDEAPLGRVTSVLTQLATEKGIIGLVLPACVLLYILFSSLRLLTRRDSVDQFTKVFVITVLAAITAVFIRELTVSTLLFRGFIFHLFCILIALHLRSTETQWRAISVSRWPLFVLMLPLAILFSQVIRHAVVEREISKQHDRTLKALKAAKFDSALQSSDQLIKTLPEHPVPHLLAATASGRCGLDSMTWNTLLDCDGNPKFALEQLSIATTLSPWDETLVFAKGWFHACKAEWPEALSDLKVAHVVDPTLSIYPLAIGIVSEKAGELNDAFKYYSNALFLDPDLCLSRFYHELILRHPEFPDSLFAAAKALYDPAFSEPISKGRIGALMYFSGNFQEAEQFLTDAQTALPGMNRPYYYLGAIALAAGDTTKTLALWDKSRTLDVNDQLVNWKYGMLLASLKMEQAKSILERALKPRTGEPLQQKQGIFYPKMAPYSNSVFSEQFMRNVNPEVDLIEIRTILSLLEKQ